jgi:hypothetical protein
MYIVLIVFNSVSGNNQIGFDLPVDKLASLSELFMTETW